MDYIFQNALNKNIWKYGSGGAVPYVQQTQPRQRQRLESGHNPLGFTWEELKDDLVYDPNDYLKSHRSIDSAMARIDFDINDDEFSEVTKAELGMIWVGSTTGMVGERDPAFILYPRVMRYKGQSYKTLNRIPRPVQYWSLLSNGRPTILETDRQIYQEAKQVLFKDNVWAFDLSPLCILHRLLSWGSLASLIQHVRFTDDEFALCNKWGVIWVWRHVIRQLRSMRLKSVTVMATIRDDEDAHAIWDCGNDFSHYHGLPYYALYGWWLIIALAQELLHGAFDALRIIHEAWYPADKDPRTLFSIYKIGYALTKRLPNGIKIKTKTAEADTFNVAFDACRPTEYGTVVVLTRAPRIA